jgi:catechol 2,3-dioxygenase-like lactoylglutathione lyase family enzyme
MVTAVRTITVGVSDLTEARRLFGEVMGLRQECQWVASRDLLDVWGLPQGAMAQIVEYSCNGYPMGRLRLVEFSPPSQVKVRADFGAGAPDTNLDVGPKAIDFYVADPIQDAVKLLVDAGYQPRSAPKKHQIGHSISEELLFSGPDDVPLLLMVGHRHAATSLRPGSPDGRFSEIATVSVVCGDLQQSRHFYGELLGLVPVNDAETSDEFRDLVCELVGAPPGTRVHFLLYAEPGEASGKILLVHFFERTGKRLAGRMQPGHLGFSLLTHLTPDLDELHRRLAAAAAPIVCPPHWVTLPSGGARLMLVRGPNEEMFEFLEGEVPR